MIASQQPQDGFSAVELLITLFIAAAFIATGYQLFAFAVGSGGSSVARTKASAIAYEALRSWQATVTGSCDIPTTAFPSDSGLTNPNFTYDCVNIETIGTVSVKRIQVTVEYGSSSSREKVSHALFASLE